MQARLIIHINFIKWIVLLGLFSTLVQTSILLNIILITALIITSFIYIKKICNKDSLRASTVKITAAMLTIITFIAIKILVAAQGGCLEPAPNITSYILYYGWLSVFIWELVLRWNA
ncbi:MAG: hypothetical protein ACK4TA_23915, partial [Saprospiraceae bacterium]